MGLLESSIINTKNNFTNNINLCSNWSAAIENLNKCKNHMQFKEKYNMTISAGNNVADM